MAQKLLHSHAITGEDFTEWRCSSAFTPDYIDTFVEDSNQTSGAIYRLEDVIFYCRLHKGLDSLRSDRYPRPPTYMTEFEMYIGAGGGNNIVAVHEPWKATIPMVPLPIRKRFRQYRVFIRVDSEIPRAQFKKEYDPDNDSSEKIENRVQV